MVYFPAFLSEAEHAEIVKKVLEVPVQPYDHHGYLAKREVHYYGSRNGYNQADDNEEDAMPDWLLPLRCRVADLANLPSEKLEMALVAKYKSGSGIGWHRDAPQFGKAVIGVSLVSDAVMRFRRFVGDKEEIFKILLEHKSAYIYIKWSSPFRLATRDESSERRALFHHI